MDRVYTEHMIDQILRIADQADLPADARRSLIGDLVKTIAAEALRHGARRLQAEAAEITAP